MLRTLTKWTADIIVDAFGITVRIPIEFTATGREQAEWLIGWISRERKWDNLKEIV